MHDTIINVKATTKTEIERAVSGLELVGAKIVDLATDGVIPDYFNWSY